MNRFEGKVALITGATSGIGRATALLFAEGGADVIVTGRRQTECDRTVKEIEATGHRGLFVQMDVSDSGSIKAGFEKVAKDFDQVDYLVSNAGREQPHTLPINDLDLEEMNMIVDTNLKGTWSTVKYGLPLIRKPGGAIVLTSSLWGTLGGAGLSAYTSTKGGINAMTRSLAIEQGANGIRVNCVSPGAIETPMLERFTGGQDAGFTKVIPLGRYGRPEEIANAVLWLCSDASSYVTGQVLGVDGGVTSEMPMPS
jgi:NAD(P)-dependent dehydrogenase (short-subunit alcohol dehydrogenase family)